MSHEVLNVEGMTCDHCKMTVSRAVSALDGVSEVRVDLEEKSVSVRFEGLEGALDQVKGAIEEAGYQVV